MYLDYLPFPLSAITWDSENAILSTACRMLSRITQDLAAEDGPRTGWVDTALRVIEEFFYRRGLLKETRIDSIY